MSQEIEHKYLVVSSAYKAMATDSFRISQGYLSRDPGRIVRVRLKADRGFLTVKGRTYGDSRLEFEYEIPGDDARELLGLCEGVILEKTRWIVPFEGYIWEVDEFHGDLGGITVAEIELETSHRDYPLPPFIGKEVTEDPRFFNSNLPRFASALRSEL